MTLYPSRSLRTLVRTLFVFMIITGLLVPANRPAQARPETVTWSTDIAGPAGSVSFGHLVEALPNGNFVVTDPDFSSGGKSAVGAVYLYDGQTLDLISTLTGEQAYDAVGSGELVVLENSNFVVVSSSWDHGAVQDAGAVTFCSGTLGCSGPVTPVNSLVGVNANDRIGEYSSVYRLENDWYYVASPGWDYGALADAGAITFCDGTTGCSGQVSQINSLVGSRANNRIGASSVYGITTDTFAVHSPYWDTESETNVGALTYCADLEFCKGTVSVDNSLVGSKTGDFSASGLTALGNGNFVVKFPYWDNTSEEDAGAVAFCTGLTGCTGVISSSNSLVGESANDRVGDFVVSLGNGNYVVYSPSWTNGSSMDVGASTWCSGVTGCSGPITSDNSLIGSTAGDQIGSKNFWGSNWDSGNYLVLSPLWDNGAVADAGAVTWCSGTAGCHGVVSQANSLVGAQNNDGAQLDGQSWGAAESYVAQFPGWDAPGAENAGLVTWCPTASGCTGPISAADSLVGSHPGDWVGIDAGFLPGGGTAIYSYWSGIAPSAGAVTVCWQPGGCPGVVSEANSLVSSNAGDQVGYWGRYTGENGALLLHTKTWNNAAGIEVGALTYCKPNQPCTGRISAANSLVGTQAGDLVNDVTFGFSPAGNAYAVHAPRWDRGTIHDVGASTWCSGETGCVGEITPENSFIGAVGSDMVGSRAPEFLPGGELIIGSQSADVGGFEDAGAVTICPINGCAGTIGVGNSLVGQYTEHQQGIGFEVTLDDGSFVIIDKNYHQLLWCQDAAGCKGTLRYHSRAVVAIDGYSYKNLNFAHDTLNNRLVVGLPMDNRVVIVLPVPPVVSLTLGSSAAVATLGQQVTYTANIQSTSGIATGSAAFTVDYGTPVAVDLVNGVAAYTTSYTQSGVHSVRVVYTGTGSFAGETVGEIARQVVSNLNLSFSLTSSADTVYSGQPVSVTATVSSTNGTPTGSVEFTGHAGLPVTVDLTNGTAVFTTQFQESGPYTIHAAYTGSGTFNGITADGDVSLTVLPSSIPVVTLTVVSSTPSVLAGHPVYFTATTGCNKGIPTGSVEFSVDGGIPISMELVNGEVVAEIRFAQPGVHTVQTSFTGSGTFSGVSATGDDVPQTVLSALFLPGLVRQ